MSGKSLADSLREIVRNGEHNDTCGAVLSDGVAYPCNCWKSIVLAALEGEREAPREEAARRDALRARAQKVWDDWQEWLSKPCEEGTFESERYVSYADPCSNAGEAKMVGLIEAALDSATAAPEMPLEREGTLRERVEKVLPYMAHERKGDINSSCYDTCPKCMLERALTTSAAKGSEPAGERPE